MANDRLEKLRKLLALADGECNESAAMAAATKAAEYASKYGLTAEMLEAYATTRKGKEGFCAGDMFYSGKTDFHPVDVFLLKAISEYLGVEVLKPRRDTDGDLVIGFVGGECEVECATDLRFRLRDAADFEWGVFRDYVWKHGKDGGADTARKSFMRGFTSRVGVRLGELTIRPDATNPTSSKSLVALKRQLARTWAHEAGHSLATYAARKAGATNAKAKAFGEQAGGRADIGKGQGVTSNVRMIESR